MELSSTKSYSNSEIHFLKNSEPLITFFRIIMQTPITYATGHNSENNNCHNLPQEAYFVGIAEVSFSLRFALQNVTSHVRRRRLTNPLGVLSLLLFFERFVC